MKQNLKDLPDINKRIQDIINEEFNGNVRRFSIAMGLPDSSKINRLFNKDKRSGEYPIPSTDIILLISNTFNISTDYILLGKKNNADHVNNINVSKSSIEGDRNVLMGNDNRDTNVTSNKDELFDIVRQQQCQIGELIKLVTCNGKEK